MCRTHIRQTLTDAATVVSSDGIGAFDWVSWNAMMRGLLSLEHDHLVDEKGEVRQIPFGRGEKPSDALSLLPRSTCSWNRQSHQPRQNQGVVELRRIGNVPGRNPPRYWGPFDATVLRHLPDEEQGIFFWATLWENLRVKDGFAGEGVKEKCYVERFAGRHVLTPLPKPFNVTFN